jgi:hypothetical protein
MEHLLNHANLPNSNFILSFYQGHGKITQALIETKRKKNPLANQHLNSVLLISYLIVDYQSNGGILKPRIDSSPTWKPVFS